MADHYVIVPRHAITGCTPYRSAEDAAVDAAALVEKDRVPRVVVRVQAVVKASATPKVDIVQIAEVPRG